MIISLTPYLRFLLAKIESDTNGIDRVDAVYNFV